MGISSMKGKRVVIYYRASLTDKVEETIQVEALMKEHIKEVGGTHIATVSEVANTLSDQIGLHRLLRMVKNGYQEQDAFCDVLYINDLINFSNTHILGVFELLSEFEKAGVIVKCRGMEDEHLRMMIAYVLAFAQDKVEDIAAVARWRRDQMGIKGKAPQAFDTDKGIRLREEGKTFLEIARVMGCSISHVYRNMPMQYRGKLVGEGTGRIKPMEPTGTGGTGEGDIVDEGVE